MVNRHCTGMYTSCNLFGLLFAEVSVFSPKEPKQKEDAEVLLMMLIHVFIQLFVKTKTRPQGFNAFSMLNLAEHEILPANKQQATGKYSFLAQFSQVRNFLCL